MSNPEQVGEKRPAASDAAITDENTATVYTSEADSSRQSTRLKAGSRVEGNYRGRGRWYPGKIWRVRANGTLDVDYDDGEKEMGLEESFVRSASASTEESPVYLSSHLWSPKEKLKMFKYFVVHDVDGYVDVELEPKDSKYLSGYKYVSPKADTDQFYVRYTICGMQVYLGTYSTAEDAAKVVAIAKLKVAAAATDVFAAAESIYHLKREEREAERLAENMASRKAAAEKKMQKYEVVVQEKIKSTWPIQAHMNPLSHPLFLVPSSTLKELLDVRDLFVANSFVSALQMQNGFTSEQKVSCETVVSKKVDLDVQSVVQSLLAVVSPFGSNVDQAFVKHGKVQSSGHKETRNILDTTVQTFLGENVEVFGLSWRYMVLKADGDAPGNTAPHIDSFGGWQLLISFTLHGKFQLQITTKGNKLVALGQVEQAGGYQVVMMGGLHSPEVLHNPEQLFHGGKLMEGCRRLLVRMSLTGVPDGDKLHECNFLELVQKIANLQPFSFVVRHS